MIPAPVPVLAGVALGYSLLGLVPYALHRLLSRRLDGILSRLLLPCAWVVIEFLESGSPYLTWGALAYTQYGNLALLQLASITGLYGISFLMTWFAAGVDVGLEQGLETPATRSLVRTFVAVFGGVLVFGGARLVLFAPTGPTVRVSRTDRGDRC